LAFIGAATWAWIPGCMTTTSSITKTNSQGARAYWKVFSKPDGTYYIIPRPEFTPEFPTVPSINSLSRAKADEWAAQLNSQLQFRIEKSIEGSQLMVRVVPEPLLEDIVDLCRTTRPHAVLENRCKKELAWASRGARPDIYMQYETCEAVAMMRALNELYGRPSPANDLCPQIDQVAK